VSEGNANIVIVYAQEIEEIELRITSAYVNLRREASRRNPSARIVHDFAETILTESATLSHFFFPAREEKDPEISRRASALRHIFGVEENSLLKNRAVRNHVAHIDERLDRWHRSSESKNFGRRMIGSIEDAIKIGLDREDILSLFDVYMLRMWFKDDEVDIAQLVFEVQQAGKKAIDAMRVLNWNEELK
jgi:hypothetical protein